MIHAQPRRVWLAATLIILLVAAFVMAAWRLTASPKQSSTAALAQPLPSRTFRFPQQDGEALYRAICQACHMPDGKGASGAGTYPALANNPRLEDGGYPAFLVINGQKAMPGFGQYLDDAQVAAVVNYVRRSFGNNYTAPISAADVAPARPEVKR